MSQCVICGGPHWTASCGAPTADEAAALAHGAATPALQTIKHGRLKPDLKADEFHIGERVTFGDNVRMRGRSIHIGDDTTIGDGVSVLCPDGFTLGGCSYIGPRTNIRCWRFQAGDYLYMEEDVIVGRGSEFSTAESTLTMGRAVFVATGCILNTARAITIGDEVGIGARVGIWTHGAYLPIDEGFPCTFAPVTIGSKVWLTGQSQVLPGVTIGDDVVIGMGSVVNRDLPSGCLAGGVPVKVLERNAYPAGRPEIVPVLVDEWQKQLKWKGYRADIVERETRIDDTLFNFNTREVAGPMSDVAEDFRDFCRRHGIRFFTGKPFRSLPHPDVTKWEDA